MDVRQLLLELGVPFKEAGQHHHATEGWLQMDCVRCSPRSGHYRLGLKMDGCYFSCWVCGGLPFRDTLAELSGRNGRELRSLLKGLERHRGFHRTTKTGGLLTLPDGLCPLQNPHKEYLRERGHDPEHLARFWKLKGLNHQAETGWAWRIFIPVHRNGEMVSYTTRAISNDVPDRYRHCRPSNESERRADLLYGYDHVRNCVIVHEGPADVWRTGPESVALMGLNCSRKQFQSIAKVPVRVICLDSEPEAQRRASRLCADLASLPGVTHRIELDSKDAGSASDREIELLRMFLDV